MPIQILINGLISGSLYALLALGFSLIYSATRVFHVSYGALYTVSVYLFLAITTTFKNLFLNQGYIIPTIGILLSLIGTGILAYLFEKLIYKPLCRKNAPKLVLFISSLGIYIIFVNLIALIFGNDTKIFNPDPEPSYTFLNVTLTRIQIIQLVVSFLLIFMIFMVIMKTSLGRNIRALSDNQTLINVIGKNVWHIRLSVFILGSMLAASSSLLKAFDVGVDPHVGLSAVLTSAVAVIIGGVGSHLGAVFAALLIGIIQNIVIWYTAAQWQDAVTFLILIIVLIFRKEGIFAYRLRMEER